MRRAWVASLLLVGGCGASSTHGEENSASPGLTSAERNETPTCTNATNFETDPSHCGRCGHACDDGACTQGMCTPRLEGDSSALPRTLAVELGVVDGHVHVGLTSRPTATAPATHPLVRFDAGKPVVAIVDRGLACGETDVECMRSDGNTLFVETKLGDALSLKRFSGGGTTVKDVPVPDDGYGSPQMSVDAGRVLLRGTVGPMALFGEDGRFTRLTELRYADWPVLSGDDVFLVNRGAVERIGLDGAVSTIGTIPRGGTLLGMAAGASAIFALGHPSPTSTPTLYRFPRTGRQVTPDLAASLSPEELRVMNAVTIGVTDPIAQALDERMLEVDGRVYFTLLVKGAEGSGGARIIVEWAEGRGFRPLATMFVPLAHTTPVRLDVSNGRLYWIEQPPMANDDDRPPWRILSLPL